ETNGVDIISFLRQIGEEIDKGLLRFIPTHDHAQTHRLMIHQPLHDACDALSLRSCQEDGLKITLLARAQSLAIFTRGVEDTGMQALFARTTKKPPWRSTSR